MSKNKDIILNLKNINKNYGTVKILKNINLKIYSGEIIAIIGKSGSGKTTLLNIIGNLDSPTSGEILYENKDISLFSSNEKAFFRNHHMGFIFQFHFLLPEFNVLDNILIPNWIKTKKSSYLLKEKALKLLEYVQLKDLYNRKISEISGGQQQRVAIVRSLLNNPKIILADEPTGNLDSDSTKQIYSLIQKINQEYNTTFIIVTHDKEVANLCHRIIEIKDGTIII